MGKIPNLREHLAEYDLFITHFGLGAFEAVYARLPVLLLSPTAYHERLSRNAGFFSLGRGMRGGVSHLFETLQRRSVEIARRFGLEDDQKEDFSSFIGGLAPHSPKTCPVCGFQAGSSNNQSITKSNPVLARFPEETFRRCGRCGVIYLSRLKPPPIEYEKDYFFDFYKKQYGKTYLEDFPNLVEMGRRRMANIKSLFLKKRFSRNFTTNANLRFCHEREPSVLPRMKEKYDTTIPDPQSPFPVPQILDIGCAYGPFLAAAAECGFVPCGIEPAEDAVRYVKDELGFTAWRGFFPDALPEEFNLPGEPSAGDGGAASEMRSSLQAGRFDAITLWYVIEHFGEPLKVLREIHRLLKDGGVLAFSTPSFSGISGRASLHSFLKKSPPDHWTVWSPRSCRRILKQYGFRLRKIIVTGHHPERFPFVGRFARPGEKGLLYQLLLFISRVFRLGDTFEAYAVKE